MNFPSVTAANPQISKPIETMPTASEVPVATTAFEDPTPGRPIRMAAKAAANFIADGIKQEKIPIREREGPSKLKLESKSSPHPRGNDHRLLVSYASIDTKRAKERAKENASRKNASRKKNSLSPFAVEYLKAWLLHPDNIEHPYPDDDEKAQIMKDTGVTPKQLKNWFVNNRKRYWESKVEELQREMEDAATAKPSPRKISKVVIQDPRKGKRNEASLSVATKANPRSQDQSHTQIVDTAADAGVGVQNFPPGKLGSSCCVKSLLALKNGPADLADNESSTSAAKMTDILLPKQVVTKKSDSAPSTLQQQQQTLQMEEMEMADLDVTSFTNSTSTSSPPSYLGGIDTTDLKSSFSMQYTSNHLLLGTIEPDESRSSKKQNVPNHVLLDTQKLDGSPMRALAVATQVLKQKDASEKELMSKSSSQQKKITKVCNRRKLPLASNRGDSMMASQKKEAKPPKLPTTKRKSSLLSTGLDSQVKRPVGQPRKTMNPNSVSTDPSRVNERVTKYRLKMKSTEEGYDQLKAQQNLYKRRSRKRSRKRKVIKKWVEENQTKKLNDLSKVEVDRLKAKVEAQREEMYRDWNTAQFPATESLPERELAVDDQLELELEMATYESSQIENIMCERAIALSVGLPYLGQPQVAKKKRNTSESPPASTQVANMIKEKMRGKITHLLDAQPKAYFDLK